MCAKLIELKFSSDLWKSAECRCLRGARARGGLDSPMFGRRGATRRSGLATRAMQRRVVLLEVHLLTRTVTKPIMHVTITVQYVYRPSRKDFTFVCWKYSIISYLKNSAYCLRLASILIVIASTFNTCALILDLNNEEYSICPYLHEEGHLVRLCQVQRESAALQEREPRARIAQRERFALCALLGAAVERLRAVGIDWRTHK